MDLAGTVKPVANGGHPVDGRDGWAVNDTVATYRPAADGWCARVRAVRIAGHSYERLHIALIDPWGVARHTMFASSWGEAIRVAEGHVRGLNTA